MADFNKRGPGCDDDCEGERGKRGKRGHRGHEGATGPTGPVANSGPPFTPPFPDPSPVELTIYARLTGNDASGNGSLGSPYRTFQRAIRDVPHTIAPGYIVTVDITGIGVEVLPTDYQFPAVAAPTTLMLSEEIGGPVPFPFALGASFNVRAFPQPATNIPLADTFIPVADVVSMTQDPRTNLVIIEVAPPRASWAADSLKSKFYQVDGSGFAGAVVYASDPTHLFLTLDFLPPLANMAITEPSATLEGSSTGVGNLAAIDVLNCPQIAYQGLALRDSTPGGRALFHSGGCFPVLNVCDVDGLSTSQVSANFLCVGSVARNYVSFDGAAFTANQSLILDAFIFNAGSAGNVWLGTVNDGCQSMGSIPTYTSGGGGYPPCGWEIVDCLFTNVQPTFGSAPVGAIWADGGGTYSLENVQIDSPAGAGITIEGGAFAFLQNVGGLTLSPAVQVNDGAQVRVLDDATDIADGGGFGMKVGVLAPRTWTNFRTIAPIKNEFDVLSPPVGDETTGAGSGGTSGSRLAQRPF